MRHLKIIVPIVLLAGILLAIFIPKQHPTKSDEDNQITVILDWFVNPDHAPLFVAQQEGYFKQQGLNVKIIAPADPNDGPKLVAAGKADITITYQAGLVQQVEQGLPLVRVGTLFDKNLNAIAVLQNGPIKTVKDLKGKRIGTSASNIDQAMIGTVLQHNGLSLKDVTMVNVNYNLVQALLSHRVDAISGIMRNFEPIEMRLAGQPARLFLPEDNGVPRSDAELWVVNKADVDKPWVKKFLQAIKQGTIYLQAHPEETWQVFASNHPELNNALNHESWIVTYPYFSAHPCGFNKLSYQQFSHFLQSQGIIRRIPKLDDYTAEC